MGISPWSMVQVRTMTFVLVGALNELPFFFVGNFGKDGAFTVYS